jgi:small ligand-binding sensory domain FIST
MKVASALRKAPKASPELVGLAVGEAMAKAGLDVARGVLLFLTADFAQDAEAAVLAAARAGNCTRVTGCAAPGVFTEEDWILDAPAVAAMVFGDDIGAAEDDPAPWQLTLTAPNAIDTTWLRDAARRLGGVSGDATGRGPYKVWTGSRVVVDGRVELGIAGERLRVAASLGMEPLCAPAPADIDGDRLTRVDGLPALVHLARHLPADLPDDASFPMQHIMAGVAWGDPATAYAEGRYHLAPLRTLDMASRGVGLGWPVDGASHVFWALRDPRAAERDMRAAIERLADGPAPDFGVCFACLGRGPAFYDGRDRDIAAIRRQWPDLPLIGFYGNGEIVPLASGNRLVQYGTVLGLYSA